MEKGNAGLPSVAKKRGAESFVAPSKDVLVGWFKELNLTHTVDDKGRIILPFRDDASNLNLNLVLVPRIKGSGAMWAVQAVIPIGVPGYDGEAGLAKAIKFSNTWNAENFLVKSSAVAADGKTFFLFEASMVCEAGIAKTEFFQNFVGIHVQSTKLFIEKAAAALN